MMTLLSAVKPMFSGYDFIGYFAFVILFIGLAFYSTRYISQAYAKGSASRNIKIIERVNLAADKSLWLVQLGDQYYLLSNDKKGIQFIDKVKCDDLKLQEKSSLAFSTVLKGKLSQIAAKDDVKNEKE